MEVRQVYYVLAVAKHQSFSKAAQALFITQPTISQQIHDLEEELQVQLFKRTTRNVTLTDSGKLFCEKGQAIVDSIDDLMLTFHQSSSTDKPLIRLGIFPLYQSINLGSIISDYSSNTPNVLISFKTLDNFEAYEMLQNNQLDLAILRLNDANQNPNMIYENLFTERLTVIMSVKNPLAGKEKITIEEIACSRILTGGQGTHYYQEVRELCSQVAAEPDIPFFNALDTDLILKMVRENRGITMMSEFSAKQLSGLDLCYAPIMPPIPFSTCIVYPKNKKITGHLLSFKKYLLQEYRQFAEDTQVL